MTYYTTLRELPKIDVLLQHDRLRPALTVYGRRPVTEALRRELDRFRDCLRDDTDEPLTEERLLDATLRRLDSQFCPVIRRVFNATGTMLHTNLGRAPLADAAIEAVIAVAGHYNTLEFDLERGVRGDRCHGIEQRISEQFGAEGALVANNNAAAVLLALAALCRGREVIVSRGELVEIGGGFRVPDIMRESGAVLVEVGTTNKTRLSDYRAAVTEHTAALMKIHRSNFAVTGFTEEASLAELKKLADVCGLPLLYDLGSGAVSDRLASLMPVEPTLKDALRIGADLTLFSGDKLLGGPQAGIAVGRRDLVDRMKSHPLMRAFRPDKMTLAALEATFMLYADEAIAAREIPLLQMALIDDEVLRRRSETVAEALRKGGLDARTHDGRAILGGGSTPGIDFPTSLIVITPPASISADACEAKLRAVDPPVIARIVRDRLCLDLRTVRPSDDHRLTALILDALVSGANEESR